MMSWIPMEKVERNSMFVDRYSQNFLFLSTPLMKNSMNPVCNMKNVRTPQTRPLSPAMPPLDPINTAPSRITRHEQGVKRSTVICQGGGRYLEKTNFRKVKEYSVPFPGPCTAWLTSAGQQHVFHHRTRSTQSTQSQAAARERFSSRRTTGTWPLLRRSTDGGKRLRLSR